MKKTSLKRVIVLHPFLFAIFPVLALYAHNMGELSLSSVWIALSASVGFALLLFTLSLVILRNVAKAGLVTAILVIIFFADGHIGRVLEQWGFFWLKHYLPILYVAILVGSFYIVYRTKKRLHNPNAILNVVGICLVVVSSLNIVVGEIRRPPFEAQPQLNGKIDVTGVTTYPDIYYVILDGYTSSDMLYELWNYDNSEFFDFLRARGFYIADRSTSNYNATYFSLASALNMEYVNYLTEQIGAESKDMTIPTRMVKDSYVASLLRSIGYSYIHLETWCEPTRHDKYADLSVDCAQGGFWGLGHNSFALLLAETTFLNRLTEPTSTSLYRSYVLNAFDKIVEVADLKGPKFVFSHIICPHWPYVFSADGESIEVVPWTIEPVDVQREKYLNQLKFVNGKVEILIDDILEKSEEPPIIILQGDHGSRLWCSGASSSYCTKEAFSILNAYHLPSDAEEQLYRTISPVNSFRIVLNECFGAEYEILSDRSYSSNIFEYPYKFVHVTDEVRCD